MISKKQILFIVVFIFATLLFSVLIWRTLLQPLQKQPLPENRNAIINGGLPNTNVAVNRPKVDANLNRSAALPAIPTVARGGNTLETVLVDQRSSGLSFTRSGPQFYNEDDQRFYRVDINGNLITLSDQQFFEADEVAFSPDGTLAIINYPDEANILFNFSTGQQTTLPKEMNEFSFSPDGREIAYEFEDPDEPEKNWIGLANPDGTDIRFIEPLGEKGDDVEVDIAPHEEVIATFREGMSGDRQEVFFIGKKNENFPSLKTNGRNFEGSYSPDGAKMLYSVYTPESNYNPTLHIVNARGNSIGTGDSDLGLETWSNKCAFGSGSTVYCAAPINLDQGAGLYRDLANDNPDEIFKIDFETRTKQRIAVPVDERGSHTTTVDSLVVSQDESMLYYIDHLTGELRSIQLK